MNAAYPHPTSAPHSSGLRAGALRLAGARVEVTYFFFAYMAYNAGRWVFAGELGPAQEHALWIWDLEQSLGLAVEGSVQDLLDGAAVSWVLSHVYMAAQILVLPGALIWLYRRSRPIYATLRNTVLATWMLAVPIYALFPVAPPRLAGLGFIDTVSQQAVVPLTGRSTIFYNLYAAVPSLHVGFAFAIGLAAAAAVGNRWAKVAALSWGPIVSLSVVATGNHYVFDVVAGLAVTAAGYAVAQRYGPRIEVRVRRRREHDQAAVSA